MNPLFIEILQIAMSIRQQLSRIPSKQEWIDIYENARKQTVSGVCFYGIQKLHQTYPEQIVNLPKALKTHWIGLTIGIKKRNELLSKQCQEVQGYFRNAGLDTTILKGHGIGSYYDKDISFYRQSGDIDIWVNASWKDVMDYVNSISPNREFDMKHTHLNLYKDTIIEVHWWPSLAVNSFYSSRLKRFYTQQVHKQCKNIVELANGITITAPDAKFDIIHAISHMFTHFLYEGVGLRQVMDLYFVLINGKLSNSDRQELAKKMNYLGLSSFAKAVMWVLREMFNMPDFCCIGSCDAKLGKILLSEIARGGNFGNHSEENHLKNESFTHRMSRRFIRRVRLIKYNPLGPITSPISKLYTLIWKHKVIRIYNL